MTKDTVEAPQPVAAPIHERVQAAQAELRSRAKTLQAAASALASLAKPKAYADLGKLDPLLAKARKRIEAFVPAPKIVVTTLDGIDTWRRERQTALRERLSRDLKTACDGAGLTMRVVSREQPVEVRIAPFAIVLDFDRATAELRFAREPIAQVPADPEAIVAAVTRSRAALDTPFDAQDFFERCITAWKAARVATGPGERVEILEFLPYLAVGMQRQRFKVAPTRENYVSYSRAQFAYDILRLRRQAGFSRGGYRMNLGVATGTTASEKKRVVYLEDEDGQGEYKLTVFFTKEERPS